MLLSQQPQGCTNSIPTLHANPITQYGSNKLFNSLLSPPAVTVCMEVSFNPVPKMAYWSTDPFDIGSVPPNPSPGLQTSHRAKSELQAELKNGPSRWDDQELDLRSTPRKKDIGSRSRRRQTRSPDDDVDMFEEQRDPSLTPDFDQLDNGGVANDLSSTSLSPADTTPSVVQPSPQDLPTRSTNTQALNIKTKRLHPPSQSPRRDPRTLFGSRETHLPWVTQLSPNRFAMTVSPDMLSRYAPPPKSVWDAEDDESDRWPTVVEARKELNTVLRNATTKRGTFVKPRELQMSVAEQIIEAVKTPMGDVTRTAKELEQIILELEDMDCGNPWGHDLHDRIITPFRSRDYPVLPAHMPARHMHVLDAKSYASRTDAVVKAARPRLCDAVATVLAYTSPECLADFLNPDVKVFEWRRLINYVMIRRDGNVVTVGNYYNLGATYQWGYLVQSTIGDNGAWAETWASVSQGTTPVENERVLFEQFEAVGTIWDVKSDDEGFALYMGRQLADFLLGYEVWNYYKWWRYRVEWKADGKVTDAREKNRYPVGLTFD